MKERAGKRLPENLRSEVKRLARKGWTNNRIALQLGIAWTTVEAWRKKRIRAFPAAKILELLSRKMDQHEISRIVRVPFRRVNAFAREKGYTRSPRRLSDEQLRAIIGDILHRDGTGAAIAKRHGVSYRFVLELAHYWLNCGKFISSNKHPLESHFAPEALPPKKETPPDLYAQLISRAFNGKLPPMQADLHLFGTLLAAVIPEQQPSDLSPAVSFAEWPIVRDQARAHVCAGLIQGLGALRLRQTAMWRN